ncbi:MAG TPA: hypothetical protein VGN57_20030 [Pirellulaceae bacterium]|jgi:hypothetical protein|nr:hypothetical protein [Pirellulaceae bacterium]
MDADFAFTDLLADLMTQRLGTLDELVKLARRQRELAQEGSLVGVVEALNAKQPLVDQLLAIERALDAYRDDDPEARVWRSDELRSRTRRMGELSQPLLAETLTIENECERLLTVLKEDVGTQLGASQGVDLARRGYAGKTARRGSLDLSTEG